MSDKVEALVEALQKIRRQRFGLDQDATLEESAEYWTKIALEYRTIARDALEEFHR